MTQQFELWHLVLAFLIGVFWWWIVMKTWEDKEKDDN